LPATIGKPKLFADSLNYSFVKICAENAIFGAFGEKETNPQSNFINNPFAAALGKKQF
jgi:hypothetical protein